MKNLLSIGEVSKLKGVSVKSLRYYDELGVLPPAYINTETGYRYYSLKQLVIIDLIIVCIDLDIPLKQFKEYIDQDKNINVSKILIEGKKLVAEKMKKLQGNVDFLSKITKLMENDNNSVAQKGEFTKKCKQRKFLVADFNYTDENMDDYIRKTAMIYKQCKELKLKDEINQGILYEYKDGKMFAKVFVEISSNNCNAKNIMTIQGGEFTCKIVNIYEAKENAKTFLQSNEMSQGDVVIYREIFDIKLNINSVDMERQKLVKAY